MSRTVRLSRGGFDRRLRLPLAQEITREAYMLQGELPGRVVASAK